MVKTTPVETLVAAGLCKVEDLGDTDKDALNKLSDEEVKALVDLHNKLGKPGSDKARPNFPV